MEAVATDAGFLYQFFSLNVTAGRILRGAIASVIGLPPADVTLHVLVDVSGGTGAVQQLTARAPVNRLSVPARPTYYLSPSAPPTPFGSLASTPSPSSSAAMPWMAPWLPQSTSASPVATAAAGSRALVQAEREQHAARAAAGVPKVLSSVYAGLSIWILAPPVLADPGDGSLVVAAMTAQATTIANALNTAITLRALSLGFTPLLAAIQAQPQGADGSLSHEMLPSPAPYGPLLPPLRAVAPQPPPAKSSSPTAWVVGVSVAAATAVVLLLLYFTVVKPASRRRKGGTSPIRRSGSSNSFTERSRGSRGSGPAYSQQQQARGGGRGGVSSADRSRYQRTGPAPAPPGSALLTPQQLQQRAAGGRYGARAASVSVVRITSTGTSGGVGDAPQQQQQRHRSIADVPPHARRYFLATSSSTPDTAGVNSLRTPGSRAPRAAPAGIVPAAPFAPPGERHGVSPADCTPSPVFESGSLGELSAAALALSPKASRGFMTAEGDFPPLALRPRAGSPTATPAAPASVEMQMLHHEPPHQRRRAPSATAESSRPGSAAQFAGGMTAHDVTGVDDADEYASDVDVELIRARVRALSGTDAGSTRSRGSSFILPKHLALVAPAAPVSRRAPPQQQMQQQQRQQPRPQQQQTPQQRQPQQQPQRRVGGAVMSSSLATGPPPRQGAKQPYTADVTNPLHHGAAAAAAASRAAYSQQQALAHAAATASAAAAMTSAAATAARRPSSVAVIAANQRWAATKAMPLTSATPPQQQMNPLSIAAPYAQPRSDVGGLNREPNFNRESNLNREEHKHHVSVRPQRGASPPPPARQSSAGSLDFNFDDLTQVDVPHSYGSPQHYNNHFLSAVAAAEDGAAYGAGPKPSASRGGNAAASRGPASAAAGAGVAAYVARRQGQGRPGPATTMTGADSRATAAAAAAAAVVVSGGGTGGSSSRQLMPVATAAAAAASTTAAAGLGSAGSSRPETDDDDEATATPSFQRRMQRSASMGAAPASFATRLLAMGASDGRYQKSAQLVPVGRDAVAAAAAESAYHRMNAVGGGDANTLLREDSLIRALETEAAALLGVPASGPRGSVRTIRIPVPPLPPQPPISASPPLPTLAGPGAVASRRRR